MYRLEIVTGRGGLRDPFIWERFPRLFPVTSGQVHFYVIYGSTLENDLSQDQRSIMDGFVEEGDILAYECREVQ